MLERHQVARAQHGVVIKIPAAIKAARTAHGLDMKWDGKLTSAIQLFVAME